MDTLLADSFEKFLQMRCGPDVVRAIEAGQSASPLWQDILETGFADALLPLAHGGAGLGLSELAGLVIACGRYALPVPLPTTMVARAMLAGAGIVVPPGAITIAGAVDWTSNGRMIAAHNLPYGMTADWAILRIAGKDWLLPLADAARTRAAGHHTLTANLVWNGLPAGAIAVQDDSARRASDWQAVGGAVVAAQIAGAMERLTDMTIAHANGRVQFGKPIGKLQIIQQQISILAEQTCAARSAALIGLSGRAATVDRLRAAVAKARASEAAATAAAVSHAVHGAIGVTEEFDLQLYTRRLYEWRMQYGSEAYWNLELGKAVLADQRAPLAFIREEIAHIPAAAPD